MKEINPDLSGMKRLLPILFLWLTVSAVNALPVGNNDFFAVEKSGVSVREAARGSSQAFTYTKSAGKHLTEVVKKGANAGQLSRPYMKSPLTIKEIMSTGKGIPDATFKGGMNWKVPGTFRGSQGIWELGINPKTNVIYHFNFVH